MWTRVYTRPDEEVEEMRIPDYSVGTSKEDQRRIEALGSLLRYLAQQRDQYRRDFNKRDADLAGHRISKLKARIYNILWR